MKKLKVNYGIDAPGTIRNLLFCGLATLFFVALTFQITSRFWFWIAFSYSSLISFSLIGTALWMLYSTKIAKPKIISRLIAQLNLESNDTVLDLGCGRGLLLIEAAKWVSQGKAHGVDLWQRQDQSGNHPNTTLLNAELEGVKERVEIQTADMRTLPYPSAHFNAVISNLALHNIPNESGREQALTEMLRVLKPGGKFLLLDIIYGKKYAQFLKGQGVEIECTRLPNFYCPPLTLIKGKKAFSL
jgi:arsenite methyltransferase